MFEFKQLKFKQARQNKHECLLASDARITFFGIGKLIPTTIQFYLIDNE